MPKGKDIASSAQMMMRTVMSAMVEYSRYSIFCRGGWSCQMRAVTAAWLLALIIHYYNYRKFKYFRVISNLNHPNCSILTQLLSSSLSFIFPIFFICICPAIQNLNQDLNPLIQYKSYNNQMNIPGSNLFLSILAFLMLLRDIQTYTIACAATVSDYYTLTPNVQYTIIGTFPVNTSITAGSYVTLQFMYRYNITNSTLNNCRFSLDTVTYNATNCSMTSSGSSTATVYTVKFPNVFPIALSNQVGINLALNITNPWGGGLSAKQSISIFLYNSANAQQGNGQASITFWPSIMNSCGFTSANLTTGVNSTKTITFRPIVPVLAGSYLQVTMPLWFNSLTNAPSALSCLGVNNSDSGTLVCGKVTTSPNQVFSFNGFVSTTKSYSSPIVLTITPLRNPWSLYPFGPITFQILNSNIPSQNCSGINLTMTTPNTFTNIYQFDLPSTPLISTSYDALTLSLTIREPFPASTGYIMISYPDTLGMTFVGSGSVNNPTNTSITLGGLSGTDLTANGSLINMFFSLTIVTPPSSRSFSFTFTSLYFNSAVYYPIDTISTTITPLTGTLTDGSVIPTSSFVNDITSYTISFTTNNALKNGSYIRVVFPSTLSVSGTCSSTNGFISCSVTNTSAANLSVSGSIPASTNITLIFNQVKNPNQVYTTASIQIYTYWDSGLDSMVDTLTTGLTITPTVRPITVSVTPVSTTTYAYTNYVFSMQTLDAIPSGGSIKITFPPTISLGNVSITSASFSTSNCSVSASANIVTLSSCFNSSLASGNHTFNLSKIYNPPSLQPTTTFTIYTAGPLGNVNYISSGVVVTMLTPTTSTNFSVVPTSPTVHALTTYTISITFAVPHQSGDYFTFTIDPTMSISSLNCTANSGVVSVSCFLFNSSSINTTFTSTPSTSVQIAISSIRNYDVSSTGISFQAFLFNSASYQMETTSIKVITYNPQTISSVTINNNQQIALYQNSNITLVASSPFAIGPSFSTNLTSLVITAPSQFNSLNNTSCSPSLGNCTFTNLTFTITPIGSSFTNFTVALGNIKLPYIATTSTSFSLSFQYNGKEVAKVTSGVTISPYCTSPCQRCTANSSACLSCLPSTNTTAIRLFSSNNSCLVNCPNGYYLDSGNNCLTCISPCMNCLDSANCTKCVANNWLYLYTCSPTCPNAYYNDSTGYCLACVSPCGNCTTASICTTCLATYYYYNTTCLNASSCPSTTFANATSSKCDPCSSPCVTCLYSSATACLTCIAGYLYFAPNNTCLLVCPDTYFNNSGTCTACINPCGNCTTASNCTSCLSNYLDSTISRCVAASSCPLGTIGDNVTKTCTTCPTGCSACTTISNCSGCTGIYIFYNYQCVISCPNSTYQAGSTCQNCTSSCQSCSGSATSCTSCTPPSTLYNNTCQANCPSGTYNSSSVCQKCLSSCQSCSNGTSCDNCPAGTFLINGLCQTSCPNSYYQDFGTGTCATCNAICATCSGSATSCNTCPSPSLYYNNSCISSCPTNYFPVNGNCITCGSCNSCSSATTCVLCISGYYLFNGVCYSNCPGTGIADSSTMTCTQCDSSCLTCNGVTTNCTSCKGGSYLYKSVCFSACPSGLISNSITNTCQVSTIGNIVYFPCSITFLVWIIIVIYSKSQYPKTEGVTSAASVMALILWFAWLVLIFTVATTDESLSATSKTAVLGVGMAGILCSLGLGIAYNVWIKRSFNLDPGFSHWLDHNKYNLNCYRIIVCLSCLTMPFFRMIYSRFFNRKNFSCFFLQGEQFLRGSNWFTFFAIIFCIMPLIFVCGFIIYIKQKYDQSLIYAIDVLVLSLFLLVFLIIDIASKGDQFFDEMLAQQPYLKRLKYNDLNQSASCLRFLDQENKPHFKTELDPKEKEQFFRMKVNFIENLDKYGQLSAPMPNPIAPPRKLKTLPDDLVNYPQLDPNQDDIVMNEEIFFEQQSRRKKIQEQQEEVRCRREQEQRLKRQQQQQEQERQKRRRRMLEDQDQQHEIQFPDLAAIQKVEQKGQNLKKSPTQLLSNFKKVDDKKINDKALKKLEQVAKKNGIDPEFMAETFGVEKNHNPQLLNAIIDKHNHVNREAVKQLFSSENNPQILQTLFGKNSALDTQKLKQLLNDPNSAQIIKNLANAQEGIIAPQIAKLLLDKNSKFSEQFVKQLLGGNNGMDQKRLKEMLKDNPDKVIKEAALKALKKIGGNNLQNKEILQMMLGQESKLSTEAFIRVANQLSRQVSNKIFRQKSQTNDIIIQKLVNNPKIDMKKLTPLLQNPQMAKQLAVALGKEDPQALQRVVSDLPLQVIQQLFGNKSEANDVIIDKVLKNKKIDLKNLTGILSDPALVEQLSLALSHEDPMVQENILNLLKNGQKLSPQLLKEFLSRPDLLKKMLSNPVDPAFLCNLLSEDAKTDLKLFEKALDNMQPQQIAKIFSFNPQKNTDFGKMAKIFEGSAKSDPKLIAELLTPQIIDNIYSKTSFTKPQILNKLVQKGKKINTNQIIKIYGEDDKPGIGFGARDPDRKYNITDNNFKYNNTDNNFNITKEDQDSEIGFKKQNNVISSMSRTDGVSGFLSPIQIGLSKGKKKGNYPFNVGSIDDISDDEEKTQYNVQQSDQKDEEEQYEVIDGVKRKKKRRPKKKPLDDIRLPSQQIYLQRLQAPHELKKKNLRKKKKKGSTSMPQLEAMDQDNQVYDLDF